MKNNKVVIVGLGYVGLPLAIEFGKILTTIGYDTNKSKINSYNNKIDPMRQVSCDDFIQSSNLTFSDDRAAIKNADFYIITVPTPVDVARIPDLSAIKTASEIVGASLKKGSIVVYESTVYPGVTEEICAPILELHSGLVWKKDFFIGYSPERVNPGDQSKNVTNIIKVVSGDIDQTTDSLVSLYSLIVTAGVYRAPSIKVAEASKVIENTQRDINIALINEISIIFNKMDIDTVEVLKAAETKWNFIPFKPGLVGGHCIGVDPYYLTYKAETLGYHPQVILSGRRINDGMASYVALEALKRWGGVSKKKLGPPKIGVLGIAFKENCSDIRNSKVPDMIKEFYNFGCEIFICDPNVQAYDAMEEYGIHLTDFADFPKCDILVLAVPHREFTIDPIGQLLEKILLDGLFVDVKSAFDRRAVDSKDFRYWAL